MERTLITFGAGILVLLLAACGNDLSRGDAASLINEHLASENKEVTKIIGITSGTNDPENIRVAEFQFQWRRDGDIIDSGFGNADFRLYDDGWRVVSTALTVEPVMVEVPAGEYMMGSPDSEESRNDDEGPPHRIKIAKPFAVGIHEVTSEQWNACVADGGCNGHRPDDEGWGRGNHPVNVSWDDIQAYVAWLRQKTGKGYRLLSEAEWEYVARAGTETTYHTGDTISPEQANYDKNVGKTTPVGSYAPNAYGLYDVHGNVWEWVEDCWNKNYEGAPSDGSVWESGGVWCSHRVLRGGSWHDKLGNLRSANRSRFNTGTRSDVIGFRLARTL